jgi:protein-tyrosine-phosphatase
MVKSKLRPDNIEYKEIKDIDEEDVGLEASLYEYETKYGITIVIALGKEKYTYSKYEIIYFPIYLVINDRPKCKIGVFEIDSNQFINILDEDNDVILEKGNILLFSFVNEEILKKMLSDSINVSEAEVVIIEDEPEEEVVIEVNDELDVMRLKLPAKQLATEESPKKDGVFTVDKTKKTPLNLVEENEEMSNSLKEQYVESKKTNWVEKFMHSNNYDIIDNEGGGDCFFAVIRDAFQQIGHDTTVEKLRKLLSDEATDDVYMQYRTLYLNFLTEMQSKDKELKEIKKTIGELKKRSDATKSKDEVKKIIVEVTIMKEKFNRIRTEKEDLKEIMDEFKHMETIDTFDKFKEFIKTSSYWADTWAVSTLERVLNIKMIILSSESFEQGDLDSVLQCGQLNDRDLENQGKFTPDFYIMTCYLGYHYQLISYKHKRILKFSEIPYDVKVLVINKCIERNAGPYYLIQDFRNLKTRLGLSPDEGAPSTDDDEYLIDDLYEPDVVFMFHSKSEGKAKAGRGSGEKIPESRMTEFNFLNKDTSCRDWRRKLDDSWTAPFQVDGHRWSSVEHYYQAAQFKKGYPDFYLQFSLDSDTDISKDIALAKAAGSKSGKYKDRVVRPKNIKFDADFQENGISTRNVEERNLALEAKFTQNMDLKKLLAETKKARLVHFIRSIPPVPDDALMNIRAIILTPSHNAGL